jgi:hypothetical protein
MATEVTEVNRERRLRSKAKRQGLWIEKSRTRNPQAIDYGCYMIVDDRNVIVAGTEGTGRPNMDLDQVEAYLAER